MDFSKEASFKSVDELPKGEVVNAEELKVLIPICCREGWASCPHVPKKQKVARKNVGL